MKERQTRCTTCNYHLSHGALDGQNPYERLLAKKTPARGSPKS